MPTEHVHSLDSIPDSFELKFRKNTTILNMEKPSRKSCLKKKSSYLMSDIKSYSTI